MKEGPSGRKGRAPTEALSSGWSGNTSEDLLPLSGGDHTWSGGDGSHQARVELKRVLGLRNGISIIAGVMIGSGIFVSPQSVVRYTGSVGASLAVWVLTGLITTLGAACYSELGAMFPESGGEYVYIRRVFGPVAGFLMQWMALLVWRPSSRAITITTFATYLLQPFVPDCSAPPYVPVRLLAAAMHALMLYINCKGVRLGAGVQDFLSLIKVAALVAIIATGVFHLASGHVEHYSSPMHGTIWDISSLATAFYSTLYCFSGWQSLNYVAEELTNPGRNLPLSIVLGTLSVTLLYTLTNAAYYAVLTPVEILSSSAVAVTFEDRVFGTLGSVFAIAVAVSSCGSTNGGILTFTRLGYAGARDGVLPSFFSLIQVNTFAPITTIVLTEGLAFFMLLANDIGTMLTYSSFSCLLFSLGSISSLLWLRYKEPQRHRPVKVWLGLPLLYLVLCIALAVLPVAHKPVEAGTTLVILAAGLPVYYICVHRHPTPWLLKYLANQVTLLCQKVFLCLPQEKGA